MFKSYDFLKNCGNIDNKIETIGYVIVFICKIRGTPRPAELNRKYQEKYPCLEIFTVNLFCRKLFFCQHKFIFITNATLFFLLQSHF